MQQGEAEGSEETDSICVTSLLKFENKNMRSSQDSLELFEFQSDALTTGAIALKQRINGIYP